MKKLYEVSKKYYVLAEDKTEAENISTFTGEIPTEAIEADSVDAQWWNCLPFGDDETDRTCGQILTEQRKQKQFI